MRVVKFKSLRRRMDLNVFQIRNISVLSKDTFKHFSGNLMTKILTGDIFSQNSKFWKSNGQQGYELNITADLNFFILLYTMLVKTCREIILWVYVVQILSHDRFISTVNKEVYLVFEEVIFRMKIVIIDLTLVRKQKW